MLLLGLRQKRVILLLKIKGNRLKRVRKMRFDKVRMRENMGFRSKLGLYELLLKNNVSKKDRYSSLTIFK